MKSRVYFASLETDRSALGQEQRLEILLRESRILEQSIGKDLSVAVKMHFGEEGNTGFVNPGFVKIVLKELKQLKAKPFLTDSNTLYKGRRLDSKSHLALAKEHGFSDKALGVPVKIEDESKPGSVVEVDLGGQFVKKAKLTNSFLEADAVVGIAHFKGHMMTGFGGAIKNIGMGVASRKGKLEQHSSASPTVYVDRCVSCGECIKFCPVNAISLVKDKAEIADGICIGCATCIGVCPNGAIDVTWEQGASLISQKMVEYTKAALLKKTGKCAFINFAIKITKECDCLAKDDPRVCPDLGIFTSLDPVAVDKACVDMANEITGKDLFRELHPKRDWQLQLNYAQKIKLGTLDYELVKV